MSVTDRVLQKLFTAKTLVGAGVATPTRPDKVAKAVLRYSACAPSFDSAIVVSMKPRWLRHMIATPSPSRIPSSASAWASALVRSCTSRNVTVPSSSTIATSSG